MYHPKIIGNYPKSYKTAVTCNRETNFGDDVINFCEQNKTSSEECLQGRNGKCVFVGDVSVGKTSIITRARKEKFNESVKPTHGFDFDTHGYLILGTPFVLTIWDTSGKDRDLTICRCRIAGAHCVVSVFDISNFSSFISVRKWLDICLQAEFDVVQPLLFIVGTKKDKVSPATLEEVEREAIILCSTYGAEYWTVLAKTGENVEQLFARIAALTFQKVVRSRIEEIESKRNRNEKIIIDETEKNIEGVEVNLEPIKAKSWPSTLKTMLSVIGCFIVLSLVCGHIIYLIQ